MFVVYEVILHLVFLAALPFFLIVGFLRGKYLTNFRERLGHYSHPRESHDLWIHAVSVGETMAAKTIADALRRLRPDTRIVITTTTITGQQTARRLFPTATVAYFPFDFSRSVRRFLQHHSPKALLLVETEIWPNVTRLCSERGMPLVLANGRISDRSFGRYRAARLFLRSIFRRYASILVRETTDRDRFIAIGAPADRVSVAGNVKFDLTVDPTPLEIGEQLRTIAAKRPIVAIGSTVAGEDELIVPLLRSWIDRGAFVLLAPRKPERFELVAGLLTDAGIAFQRRSEWKGGELEGEALLLDTIGELARAYQFAAASFVGGSLLPGTGGHNPIEPAAAGSPVAFGPYMSNFREIAALFLTRGGAVSVEDATALDRFIATMLTDDSERRRLADLAAQTVSANQGAASRIASRLSEAMQ